MPVPVESDSKSSESAAANGAVSSVSPPPAAAAASPEEEQLSGGGVEEQESDGSGPEEKPLKLFVGGLSWKTEEDKLRECFEAYGEVTECSIMKDPVQKRSRGFGFVTFVDGESVESVLDAHAECPISIDDKVIDPKIAIPPKRLSNKVKRIFVGGLSSESTVDDLREYFEDFGKPFKVCETQLMYDRNTNRHRGFGFVTFESETPAEKACSIQYHDIRGKKVEVKIAQTKEALAMQQGRGRSIPPARTYSYGYYSPPYQPYYNYPVDMVNMAGGYSGGGPLLLDGGRRGSKTRGSYYPAAFGYGWAAEQPRMSHGYYPTSGYAAGIPVTMMRTESSMVPTSAGVDYLSDHFQGMSMSAGYGGYAPQSPAAHFTAVEPGPYSTSPPHSHSPKSTGSANSYTAAAQVPPYGGQSSYAVAQPSY